MKTKRLTATVVALLLAITSIALMSSPAAAHHEQSCHYAYQSREVNVWGWKTINTGLGSYTTWTVVGTTTVWGQVRVCTTIEHPPPLPPTTEAPSTVCEIRYSLNDALGHLGLDPLIGGAYVGNGIGMMADGC